jgi:putative ATPase
VQSGPHQETCSTPVAHSLVWWCARCCVWVFGCVRAVVALVQLTPAQLEPLLSAAITDRERGLGDKGVAPAAGVLSALATLADGDARSALNALELAVNSVLAGAGAETGAAPSNCDVVAGAAGASAAAGNEEDENGRDVGAADAAGAGVAGVAGRLLTLEVVRKALQKTHLLYDRSGEQHYNIISALHKSMRGSDPDAALYWCGRMLQAGENPRYVTRRLIRFASEDVGLADPNALLQAVAADTAAQAIGMPEANVVIGQCVAYLALCPKSVAIERAMAAVSAHIRSCPNEPVPHVIRNAPTKLMKAVRVIVIHVESKTRFVVAHVVFFHG